MTLLLICKTSEQTMPLQYDQTWEKIKIIISNGPLVSPFVFSIFNDIIHTNEVPIKKEPVDTEKGHNTKRISVEDHAAIQTGVAMCKVGVATVPAIAQKQYGGRH